MSCTEFENIVAELADDRITDALSRRQLQSHAAECPDCFAHLAAQRRLSGELDSLARETDHLAADPALKQELLAAFAELHAPERNFVLHKSQGPRYWLLAAAAAILVTVVTAAVLMRPTPELIASVDPAPLATPSPVATPAATPDVSRTPDAAPGPANRTTVARRVNQGPRKTDTAAASSTTETTTEYLPLTYMNDQTALQTGVVVRVEIPRTTLLSMGLPMNTDRADTLVKADVIVGDDGVPRAIRLVQE